MSSKITERFRTDSSDILTALWLGSFCVCLFVPIVMRLRSGIESDTLMTSLGSIADAYAANLAVILGFYFHARYNGENKGKRSGVALVVAIVATLIWNVLAVGACIAALFYLVPIDETTKTIAGVAPKLSWLVAPMLGYYFASSKDRSAAF